ncbi:leucine-rich repeat protein [Helicobacter typhlonius]|uniref:leucine-rich repeat protein n=1 Tax=Helicobacter typhlonius TaxID=76936 RepID=UPI0034DD8A34
MEYAFYKTSLTSFIILHLIREIDKYTFAGCSKLKIIEISENSDLDYIYYNAFRG